MKSIGMKINSFRLKELFAAHKILFFVPNTFNLSHSSSLGSK